MHLKPRLTLLAAFAAAVFGLPLAVAASTDNQLPPGKAAEAQPNPPTLQTPPGLDTRKPPARPATPEPQWRSGIIDSGLAPFPSSLYTIVNQWQDIVAGKHVNVYAGADANDPQQGLLVVQTTPLDESESSPPDVYRAADRVGSLEIVRAEGAVLTLQAGNGSTYRFVVATRQLAPTRNG